MITNNTDGTQRQLYTSRLQDTNGNTNMAVDGSTTPVSFKLQPPQDQIIRVASWFIYIEDEKGFNVTDYAALNTPLTNGMTVNAKIGGKEGQMFNFPIKAISDILSVTYEVKLNTFGNDNDVLVAEIDFTKFGQYVRLDGSLGDYLEVVINDDLTELGSQYVTANGYFEDKVWKK